MEIKDYPSNSHKSKNQAKNDNKVEKRISKPVATGTVRTAKKSELRKFTDAFVAEDASNVKSFILQDVIIPAAKRILDDVIVGSLRMFLYGDKGRPGGGGTNASKVSYRSYYERENDRRRDTSNNRVRSGFDYDTITFESRGDAEAVLSTLDAMLDQYEIVSVADYYDAANISTDNYMVNRYGWTNLSTARVERNRDGEYYIKLPRAMPLN